MRPFVIAVGALLAMVMAAPAAQAQLSENGGPVSYSANNLEYFDGDRRLVLTGDVDIVQNDARLRADKITLYFSPAATPQQPQAHAPVQGLGSGDIQRMLAEGDVYYVRPLQSARGNNADYEVAQDSVTFSGNVVVASNENVIRGETLVLHIATRQTTIAPQPGQRVRGVFVPQNGQGQQQGQHPAQTQQPAGNHP
jgi:lipopolysaccharide export system protein LptA